jgi:hypothetical protein
VVTDHRALGVEWQQRATAALAPVTDLFPRAPGAKWSWDDPVLDEYAVARADRCLRAADTDDYEETTTNARRRVGLAVLARVREDGVDPVTAFGAVIDDRDRIFTNKLASWIDTLGPGGRAALASDVVTWTSTVGSWGPLWQLAHADAEVTVAASLDWDVPGRAIRVRARADVLAPRGARPADRRLLVVASSLADAGVIAGHSALGYTLSRASVPAQVAVLVPASGSERFTVDDDLLDEALTRLVAAAHAAVAARMGPEAPATPGWWCRRCSLREECPESVAWSAGQEVRFGGLRPLVVGGGADDGA